MQKTYVLEDIIYSVIELEEACMDLYAHLSLLASNDEYRAEFAHMASSESHNKRFFNDFVRGMDYLCVLEKDYVAYLRSLLLNNNALFSLRKKKLDQSKALKATIHMEKDLLILLYEVKRILGSSCPEVLEKLIRRRQKHIRFLFTISNDLIS